MILFSLFVVMCCLLLMLSSSLFLVRGSLLFVGSLLSVRGLLFVVCCCPLLVLVGCSLLSVG